MPPNESPTRGARYARQAALGVIGAAGQERLAASTVLILGCGALGSTQAELLARADVTPANIEQLLRPADLVLDGTDNFETRYLLNDAAVRAGKPWVYGGVLGSEGTVMAVLPGEGPCLRCVFSEPPAAGQQPTCETQGVLGPAVAWVAALQVALALKRLVGEAAGDTVVYALDIWRGSLSAVPARRNAACVCCGQRRFEFLAATRGSSSTVLCGRSAVQITPERPTAPDFHQLSQRLSPLGKVTFNGPLLEFTLAAHRLVVFPDGRVLVTGTTDLAEARSLVAKYIGS